MVRPDLLVRAYGMDPGEMNGVSSFGWRLFAARNLVLGGAAIAGAPWARDITLLVQAPDQLVFFTQLKPARSRFRRLSPP